MKEIVWSAFTPMTMKVRTQYIITMVTVESTMTMIHCYTVPGTRGYWRH